MLNRITGGAKTNASAFQEGFDSAEAWQKELRALRSEGLMQTAPELISRAHELRKKQSSEFGALVDKGKIAPRQKTLMMERVEMDLSLSVSEVANNKNNLNSLMVLTRPDLEQRLAQEAQQLMRKSGPDTLFRERGEGSNS